MGKIVQFLILLFVAFLLNLVDCAKKEQPSEENFKKQHVISRGEYRRYKANGRGQTKDEVWDSIARDRGVEGKSSNTFIKADYHNQILPSARKSSPVKGRPSDNIYRTKDTFTQYNINRENGRTVTKSRKPVTFGSDFLPAPEQGPIRKVPIHYEGSPRAISTTPGPTKKPKKFRLKGSRNPFRSTPQPTAY